MWKVLEALECEGECVGPRMSEEVCAALVWQVWVGTFGACVRVRVCVCMCTHVPACVWVCKCLS